VEGSHISSDGFKTIDGGGDAGLTKSEVLGKLKWDISKGDRTQNIEFRLGLSYEDSNETYLGLARQDFDQNPYRRYSSSALDNMNWDHQKFQIRHNLQLSETALLETVAYRHNYNRTWARMDKFFGGNAANSFTNVLNNPSSQPAFYNILIGAADSASQGSGGQLELASNKREFFSQGVQSKYTDEFSLNLKSGVVKIEPEVFIRAHQDQIIRDQVAEIYEMETGQLFTTGLQRQNNLEEQTTTALTFSSRANITYKSYIVTPVIRMESVDYDFRDDIDPARNASRTDLAFIPGISLFKRLTPNMSVGTSYNKAASLAGLSNSGDEIRETADNYELLFKYLNQDLLLQADATAFYTNYQNITGTCTVSTGCLSGSGEAFNGGAADIMGFEAGATKGFFAGPVYVPFGLNLTYLDATFSSDFASSSPEWGQGNVQSGDPLPYIPELQYTVSLGAEYKNFGTELFYTYQSKVFDQSVQAGRVTIDDFSFIDLGGFYNLNEALKINYRISNLFDKDYAVAARPFGLRPGQPRALQVGFKYTF
jgi:Fe(3+) dicitrate transport protein